MVGIWLLITPFQPNCICLSCSRVFIEQMTSRRRGLVPDQSCGLELDTDRRQRKAAISGSCMYVWAGEHVSVYTHVRTADFGWMTGLWVRTLQGHRPTSRGQSASPTLRCSLERLDRQFCLFFFIYIIIKVFSDVSSEEFTLFKKKSLHGEVLPWRYKMFSWLSALLCVNTGCISFSRNSFRKLKTFLSCVLPYPVMIS